MKRSESDGTDLSVKKNILAALAFLLLTVVGTASANQIHLYNNNGAYQGVLIMKGHVINVESIIENNVIEGIFETDNPGGNVDSVNDGTGGSTESVNDGTGGSTESVNDGTGGSTDSVNDGTGDVIDALNNGDELVFSIDTNDCNTMYVSTKDNDYKVALNTVKLNNNDMNCQ